jgi:hypothetical protein
MADEHDWVGFVTFSFAGATRGGMTYVEVETG